MWVVTATPRPLYPLCRRLRGSQERTAREWIISPPPGFDPRTVQPVSSRYTDWAIQAHRTEKYKGTIIHIIMGVHTYVSSLFVLNLMLTVGWPPVAKLTTPHDRMSGSLILWPLDVSPSSVAQSFTRSIKLPYLRGGQTVDRNLPLDRSAFWSLSKFIRHPSTIYSSSFESTLWTNLPLRRSLLPDEEN